MRDRLRSTSSCSWLNCRKPFRRNASSAAMRSGSLRTAFDAAELHRYVMGVPGAITSPMSAGVHRLISENVANLITQVEDVIALISPLEIPRVDHPLLALLSRRQGITAEELAHLGALEVSQAFAA
ncbi:MAG: hypothetical protein EBY81_02875, partial [Verrucomicrobia bacterium]|nr:hypothetical protein [Verrucomicrobiota bacterium]